MARRFNPDKFLAELDRLGISQRRLSRIIEPEDKQKAEQRRSMLSSHVRGKVSPTEPVMQRYADALGIDVDAFTDDQDADDPEMAAILEEYRRLRERQEKRRERKLRRRRTAA